MTARGPSAKKLWQDAVIDAGSLSPVEKLVGLTMARFGDSAGRDIRPGVAKVAAATGYHRSTVERARKSLVASGWLREVVAGGIVDGRRLASVYQLQLPAQDGESEQRLPAQDGESGERPPRTGRSDSPHRTRRLPACRTTLEGLR